MYPQYAWKTAKDTPFMRESIPRLCVENFLGAQQALGWAVSFHSFAYCSLWARSLICEHLADQLLPPMPMAVGPLLP